MQLKYDREAQKKGVYILSTCGFDSIPCELGVQYLKKRFGGELNAVETYLTVKSGPQVLTQLLVSVLNYFLIILFESLPDRDWPSTPAPGSRPYNHLVATNNCRPFGADSIPTNLLNVGRNRSSNSNRSNDFRNCDQLLNLLLNSFQN